MNFVCHNGEFFEDNALLLSVQNRGFKYGDGVFETMKVVNGELPLAPLHFERLFLSLSILKMDVPAEMNEGNLLKNIFQLCERNKCPSLGRVRLTAYRNEQNQALYVIEAIPLTADVTRLNEEGLIIDIFPYAKKSCDTFSNLKTANFLPYVMAGLYAGEKNLDDCIVLNTENNICDTSRANIFIIKGNELFTPALHQGCINGVMRRHVIEQLKRLQYVVHQKEIQQDDLLQADEMFLTNAVYGIRWVRQFKDKTFGCSVITKIYSDVFKS